MTAVTDVVDKEFDVVIAGGGTAGLALASRLTEDPSISVAVIEAGEANADDPKILVPAQFGGCFGDPKYDWFFPTVKQKHSNDKEYFWSRGKGLGGSSAINFQCWIKPPAEDFNAIEKLGNPGWNWDEFLKYSLRAETFHVASKEHSDVYPHTHEPKYRGTSGPIQTTVPHHVHTVDHLFQDTLEAKGVKKIRDPYGGDITGTWMAASNLDPKTWTRSYSATAYYIPNKDRKNLTVITEAVVSRVLFADAAKGKEITATGLEFVHGGKTHVVHAKKEVVLSAGAIKSPQILELSGIGRPEVLSKIGVEAKIELPGVGENVQDHVMVSVSFELNPNVDHETLDRMSDPEYAAEAMKLHAEGKGIMRLGITSFAYPALSTANPKDFPVLYAKVAKDIEERKKSGKLPPGLAEQLDLQLLALKNEAIPDLELVAFPVFGTSLSKPEPGKSYVTIISILNHGLSRGTIHATSNDPLTNPEIDPNYFAEDFDLESLVQHIKFIRSFNNVEPWKSGTVKEIDPGLECTTDEEIRDYIKETLSTTWHTVGSCSMLPREKQGVVDSNLKVYGTTNLRVCDISVIPLHLAAHTQVTAYVIGEKAAEIIAAVVRK